jgi:hypothetical protein
MSDTSTCGAPMLNGGRCTNRGRFADGRCGHHTTDPAVAAKRGQTGAAAFRPGDPRTIQAGRKGGLKRAEQRRQAKGPFEGTILDMLDAAGLVGETWTAWRVFLKAVFALPMTDEELAIFQRHTEREKPPEAPVSEAWMAVGRGGGKSRISGLVGAFMALRFDVARLAPGELAIVPVIAVDRKQARAVFGYQRALFEMPEFGPYLSRPLKEALELRTGVDLEIVTASYRTTRGFTAPAVICDEVAYWTTDDGGANPDSEILTALRPAAARAPGSLVLGLSSPYAARGELYAAYQRFFGQDDSHVLVWNADTRSMNPSFPEREIERAFEVDPTSAMSEYGRDGRVVFRHDIQDFLAAAAISACTVPERRELAPLKGPEYFGFVDPSGGGRDSFALGVSHNEKGMAVLDLLRERRPPFSPDDVVAEYAAVLKSYGITSVTGDRYALGWVVERFRRHGVDFLHAKHTKSELYLSLLPMVNAATCELLDLPALHYQLLGLERRTARGGKDSVDHRRGARDDLANVCAGALVLAAPSARGVRVGEGMAATLSGILDGLTQPAAGSVYAGGVIGSSLGVSGAAEDYVSDPYDPDYRVTMIGYRGDDQ